MIQVKHFADRFGSHDGRRMWVEPIGLCRDMQEWCAVTDVMPHLGPPPALRQWFEHHPDGYDYFRAQYHEHLREPTLKIALQAIACAGLREDLTLLHAGDCPEQNVAIALHEFLQELEAYCPRDSAE